MKLVAHVSPVVLAAARVALGRNDPDVEDLAQESLIAFVRSLGAFRRECSVEHFARRVTLHRCLDLRKHRRVAERARYKLLPGDDAHPLEVLPGESELMRGLISELPFEQAEVLLLRYVWEYGVSEIAEMTGVPVNTVRSRQRLARDHFRLLLARRGLKLSGRLGQ